MRLLRAGGPQHVVPVHAPVGWPVIGQNARRAGNTPGNRGQQGGEAVSAFVIVDGIYDSSLVRHLFYRGQDQAGLRGVERSARADIARAGGLPDGEMAQGVDGGFTDDDIEIVVLGPAAPQAFLASGREAGKVTVLDLVTADAVAVDMGEDGIAAH